MKVFDELKEMKLKVVADKENDTIFLIDKDTDKVLSSISKVDIDNLYDWWCTLCVNGEFVDVNIESMNEDCELHCALYSVVNNQTDFDNFINTDITTI